MIVSYEYNGYKIENSKGFALKVVKPIGKGSVPDELKGLYTSSLEAERSITRYLTSKEKLRGKATKSS